MRRQHTLNHSTVSDVRSSEPATATHVHPSCQRSSQPALHAPSLAEPHSAHPSHEKKEYPLPNGHQTRPSILAQNTRRIASSRCRLLYRSNCTGRACTALIISDQHQCSFFPFCSSPPTRCGGLSAHSTFTLMHCSSTRVKVCTVRDSGSMACTVTGSCQPLFLYLCAADADARCGRALGPLCPFLVVFVGSWGEPGWAGVY